MNLSIADIQQDIQGFKQQIAKAKNELAALPEGYIGLKQHKHREKNRRALQAEIKYCAQLIGYALEGISIRAPGGRG